MRNSYYLIRHGESEANVQHLLTCNPATALTGYGLTSKGREQSRESAHRLKQCLAGDVLVYSSDFLRAMQTAEYFASIFGDTEVRPDVRLRERDFGKLDGTSDSIYGPVWTYDADPEQNAFGVESLHALLDRILSLIHELEERYSGKHILLVSHGDPLVAINSYTMHGDFRPPVHNIRNAEVRRIDAAEPLIIPA